MAESSNWTWGEVVAGLILTPFVAILHGWALSLTWGWFIVPTFSAPPLRIPVAIGIATVVAYMTRHIEDGKTFAATLSNAVVRPLLLVATCWIVRLFV